MEYNIDELVSNMDFNSNRLVDCGRLMLTNKEISVLKAFGINYLKCNSLKEILFEIDKVSLDVDDIDLEDLEDISLTIAERDYYQNTNK